MTLFYVYDIADDEMFEIEADTPREAADEAVREHNVADEVIVFAESSGVRFDVRLTAHPIAPCEAQA